MKNGGVVSQSNIQALLRDLKGTVDALRVEDLRIAAQQKRNLKGGGAFYIGHLSWQAVIEKTVQPTFIKSEGCHLKAWCVLPKAEEHLLNTYIDILQSCGIEACHAGKIIKSEERVVLLIEKQESIQKLTLCLALSIAQCFFQQYSQKDGTHFFTFEVSPLSTQDLEEEIKLDRGLSNEMVEVSFNQEHLINALHFFGIKSVPLRDSKGTNYVACKESTDCPGLMSELAATLIESGRIPYVIDAVAYKMAQHFYNMKAQIVLDSSPDAEGLVEGLGELSDTHRFGAYCHDAEEGSRPPVPPNKHSPKRDL